MNAQLRPKSPCRGCPTTPGTACFVILSEAKNLATTSTCASEILRLTPQNDVVGQPLYSPLRKWLLYTMSKFVVRPFWSPIFFTFYLNSVDLLINVQ